MSLGPNINSWTLGKGARELARRIAEAKGMDAPDPVLCKALAYRIVQALTLQWKRGGIGSEGIRRGVRAWVFPLDHGPSHVGHGSNGAVEHPHP